MDESDFGADEKPGFQYEVRGFALVDDIETVKVNRTWKLDRVMGITLTWNSPFLKLINLRGTRGELPFLGYPPLHLAILGLRVG